MTKQEKISVLMTVRMDFREFQMNSDCRGREIPEALQLMSLAETWQKKGVIDPMECYQLFLEVTRVDAQEGQHEHNGRK